MRNAFLANAGTSIGGANLTSGGIHAVDLETATNTKKTKRGGPVLAANAPGHAVVATDTEVGHTADLAVATENANTNAHHLAMKDPLDHQVVHTATNHTVHDILDAREADAVDHTPPTFPLTTTTSNANLR